jgi:hypothetical protein
MPREKGTDRVCANCLFWTAIRLRAGVEVADDLEIKHADQVGECRLDRPVLVVSSQVEEQVLSPEDGLSRRMTTFKYATRFPRPTGDKSCQDGVYRAAYEEEEEMVPFYEDALPADEAEGDKD